VSQLLNKAHTIVADSAFDIQRWPETMSSRKRGEYTWDDISVKGCDRVETCVHSYSKITLTEHNTKL